VAEASPERARTFVLLQQVVTAARELRADHKLDPKAILPATLCLRGASFSGQDLAAIAAIARLEVQQQPGALQDHKGIVRTSADFDLQIHTAAAAQNGSLSPEARARIAKDVAGQVEKNKKLLEGLD
jgi:valyl-tRNA synthetase